MCRRESMQLAHGCERYGGWVSASDGPESDHTTGERVGDSQVCIHTSVDGGRGPAASRHDFGLCYFDKGCVRSNELELGFRNWTNLLEEFVAWRVWISIPYTGGFCPYVSFTRRPGFGD